MASVAGWPGRRWQSRMRVVVAIKVRPEVTRYDGFLVARTDEPKASSQSGCKVWIRLHVLMLITIFALACPSLR